MISGYSCKRETNRWPLAMFYNILNIACLASFIIYNHLQPAKQSDKRRKFLTQLAIQLVTPHIEVRAMNGHVSRQPRIKQAMTKFGVIISISTTPVQVASPTTSASTASALTAAGQSKKEWKHCVHCRADGEPRRKTRASCNACAANN